MININIMFDNDNAHRQYIIINSNNKIQNDYNNYCCIECKYIMIIMTNMDTIIISLNNNIIILKI